MGPSHQERYKTIKKLIQPYESIWNLSLMKDWFVCRSAFPVDWLHEIKSLSIEDLYRFDQWISSGDAKRKPSLTTYLNDDLIHFIDKLFIACQFKRIPQSPPLPKIYDKNLTLKKRHELGSILGFLGNIQSKTTLTSGIDLGGGVGHLSRVLHRELNIPMCSVDANQELQNLGKKSLIPSDEIVFKNALVEDSIQDIDQDFANKDLSIGLHTCGKLAMTHISKSLNVPLLINFGCCYDRMDPNLHCERSLHAKADPLNLTLSALFLATRGRQRTFDELKMQRLVNSSRFGLQLYIESENISREFVAVGDASPSTYHEGFFSYAADRLTAIGFAKHVDHERIVEFWAKSNTQDQVYDFFVSSVLRNLFARPIEVLLLLDRCLWIEEQGFPCEIMEFFNHNESPRNLGIVKFRA